MSQQDIDVDAAAREIADMLHSDSHIPQSESIPIIRDGLRKDGDRVPNLYQRECLAFGGALSDEAEALRPDSDIEDDDGSTPSVDLLFPHTSQMIADLLF